MADRTLDARGLGCPLPVLKARKLLRQMEPGEHLTVLATDARSPQDLTELCGVERHQVVARSFDGETHRVLIRCGG